MRKSIIGISLILGFAGTASADQYTTSPDYDVSGDGYVDDVNGDGWISAGVELPAIQPVAVEARPGFVWIEGHYTWDGYDWEWVDGFWVRERPQYLYVQGRWEANRGRYRWITGRWAPRPRTVIVRNYGNGSWVHHDNDNHWNHGNWNHGNWDHDNDNHGNHGNWNHDNDNDNHGNHGNWNHGNDNHGGGVHVVRPDPRPRGAGNWNRGNRGGGRNVQVRDHRNGGRGR